MAGRAVLCEIYRTAIPMRGFEHSAAAREVAEAVVVRVEFEDGAEGWGETLPRKYVTGETLETVVRDISQIIWPACRTAELPEGIETAIAERHGSARCINAAACAVELAWLWPGLPSLACGRRTGARVSGVLSWRDPAATARRLRLMRLCGLRDIKVKLGLGEEVDTKNLRVVHKQIGRAVARGKRTLRVDVNGGWSIDETPQRVAELKQFGVCVVEQPVYCSAAELVGLAGRCDLPLMADESLLTAADAKALLAAGQKIWWNIRISKNGGILRSKALAELAAENHVPFTIGCMVGESSILSAAQRAL
ncbi:MAG: enolase C-terminal domain-like protein, partial [Planctomycetota bacterium]